MKYIDADKLIAEIEKWSDGKLTLSLLIEIKEIITSIQQEQPEIKSFIEKLLKECIDNPGEYYRGRREILAHLFYHLGGNPLEYLRFIKQPEVDLEKEIIRYQREDMDRDTTVGDVARHFYELGKNSK